jgi:hypothetical protein
MLLAIGCTEETLTVREYPRVETSVVEVTSDNIIFRGQILANGNVPITEHGFTWSTGYPNIRDSQKVALGEIKNPGEFKSSVSKTVFEKNKTYSVRAYSLAGGFEVYGPVVSFVVK